MNKRYIKYLIPALAVFTLVSCKKNNIVIDNGTITPPEAARFLPTAATATFWVANGPGGGNTYKIPIGITTTSDVDRQVTLTYTSTTGATKGTHYNAPATLTIPAGKTLDTLAIQGLFAAYDPTKPQNLKITITSGTVKANAYNNTFTLTMRVPCPVVAADLEGAFDNTLEYTSSGSVGYGPYYTELYDFTPVTATSATGMLFNIYDEGWNDLTTNFEWSSANPTNWTVTIPKQATGRTSGGNPVYVRTSPGQPSTFNSCDNSITIFIDRLGGAAGTTVLTSAYKIVLSK
jgi:hypothetical protein